MSTFHPQAEDTVSPRAARALAKLNLKTRVRVFVAATAASALAITGATVVPVGPTPLPPAVAQENVPTDPSEPADIGRCVAAGLGIGLPLLLLAPLGLAGQVNLPGVSQWQAQIEPQIRDLNTRLQQQAGIFNPELARMAEEFNAQMARPEVRAAVGGIGLLLAGLAIGGIMMEACAPDKGSSDGSSELDGLTPLGSSGTAEKPGTADETDGAVSEAAGDAAEAEDPASEDSEA